MSDNKKPGKLRTSWHQYCRIHSNHVNGHGYSFGFGYTSRSRLLYIHIIVDHVICILYRVTWDNKSKHSILTMEGVRKFVFSCFLLLSIFDLTVISGRYTPDWKSLDARPLPSWYDEAKLGIFVHWGVFSVPAFSNEWFWNDWKNAKLRGIIQFMEDNYKPYFTYADFAKQFTAEFYNSDQWADMFNSSGAR